MKKLVLFMLLCCSGMAIGFAQDPEENTIVREALDKMFEHLDKTKVPTGLLLDYAFDLVDFDRYDGSQLTDSNYVGRTVFECLLRSVKSASVGGSVPVGDVSSIMDDMARDDGSALNVGLLLFRYNYIREDALEKEAISYVNDQVYDSYDPDGNWRNPYAEKYVIGFSSYNQISFSPMTVFAFPSELVFSNVGISKMEFDAGDGIGYRVVTAGGTVSTSYQEGTVELKMRVTLESGDVLVCHSKLLCDPEGIRLQETESAEEYENPDMVEYFEYTSGGKTIRARASVYYSESNPDLSVRRPFIIAEGFDPVDLVAVGERFGLSRASGSEAGYHDSGFTGARSYYSGLKSSGSGITDKYDIIYIDWMNSEADIRDNARLLIKIVDWVNAAKLDAGSDERNIVLGESMGGLVARYALRTMELEDRPHETAAYISHDSPHLGAHVPLGALYGIRGLLLYYYNAGVGMDILKMAFQTDSDVYALRKYLYSVSARQMLVNYVNSLGMIDNQMHAEWQDELAAIGFPAGDSGDGIMNLAIVNGGVLDPPVSKPYVTADGNVYTSGLTDLVSGLISGFLSKFLGFRTNFWDRLPGTTNLSCHVEVNPYFSYGAKVFDMNIGYTKKILCLVKKHINIFSMTSYAPSSGLMYDGFPGSIYNGYSMKFNEVSGWGDLLLAGGYGFDLNLYDAQFMFIPTASALCYGNGRRALSSADYSRPFCSSPPEPVVEMPFHAVFMEQEASPHISPLAGMYSWIKQHTSMKIDGPLAPVTGDRYVVSDCPYSVTWSSSDPAVLAIDRTTGVVTVNGTGYVTIKAGYVAYGQECSLSKSVMVGFPELYITAYLDGESEFVAEAKCVSDEEKLSRFIRDGAVSYEWGLKSGNGTIEWTVSSSPVFETGVKKWGSGSTDVVYVRLVAENGTKGKAYSKMLNFNGKQYYVRPKCFIVNKSGELYSYDPKYGYPCLLSEEDLPLKISYTIYTPGKPDYSLPRAVVVNDKEEYPWMALPQPDMSTWMFFPLCFDDELYDLLEQMKPRGDMERFVFWVSAYDHKGDLVHLTPIHLVYRPDITGNDFMPDDLLW